jgi:hypothetical protein
MTTGFGLGTSVGLSQYRNAVASGRRCLTGLLAVRSTRRYRVTVLTETHSEH